MANHMHDIPERHSRILKEIIREYITTVEPVSSKALAERHSLGLSPASIRNAMAGLESAGYLKRLHASAGAIPTDKSFRLYVDTLNKLAEPGEDAKCVIRRFCLKGAPAPNLIMRNTSKGLSLLTNCAGFAFTRLDLIFIKRVRFIKATRTAAVIVIESRDGLVYTKLVNAPSIIGHIDLEKVSNYLNTVIKGGPTLKTLRDKVREDMKKEKSLYRELKQKTLKLIETAHRDMSEGSEETMFVEGGLTVLEQPEFKKDVKKMGGLLKAFEEKALLVKILDGSINEGTVGICIGSECDVREFEGLSFVSACYGKKGSGLGYIGVIGPVRMNYTEIIPIVNYTAEFLSKAI